MRLTVRHETRYHFDAPVTRLVQSHRLWPSEFAGQHVIGWTIDVPGAETGAGFRDGAGDWTQTVSLRGPVEALDITVSGEVETADLAGVLKGFREKVPPSAYRHATQRTKPDSALRALSAEALSGHEDAETLARAHRLSAAASEAVAYKAGGTEAATTAAEALSLGEGVCQDHAHVLMALAHAAGIPARYVAGYLFAGGELQGAEASHAWAELWVEGLGWVGFDAANACCPDDRYVRLCSGFDAGDAAPVRGVVQGAATETLDVAVSVSQSGQSQSQSQSQPQGAGQSQAQRQQ